MHRRGNHQNHHHHYHNFINEGDARHDTTPKAAYNFSILLLSRLIMVLSVFIISYIYTAPQYPARAATHLARQRALLPSALGAAASAHVQRGTAAHPAHRIHIHSLSAHYIYWPHKWPQLQLRAEWNSIALILQLYTRSKGCRAVVRLAFYRGNRRIVTAHTAHNSSRVRRWCKYIVEMSGFNKLEWPPVVPIHLFATRWPGWCVIYA